MSLYLVARSMHIVAMFLTIMLIMGAEPLFLSAARAPDIAQLEQRYRMAQRLLQFSQVTMLVGLLAGVALVVMAGWDPLAPWLLVTYGLLVVMSVIGRMGTGPWQQHVQRVLQPSAGSVGVADVRALLADRRALLARVAVIVIFLTIIAVMRAKPSFGF
jgi:uncharacterized membrane protein